MDKYLKETLSCKKSGNGTISISWKDTGNNRYHIWLDDNERPYWLTPGIVFKNPPQNLNRGDEGYFYTRHLKQTSKVFQNFKEHIEDFKKTGAVEKAKREYQIEKTKEKATDMLSTRKNLIQEHAVDFYNAIGEFLKIAEKEQCATNEEIKNQISKLKLLHEHFEDPNEPLETVIERINKATD